MNRPTEILLSSLLLFLCGLALFTRENRFPFYYHPDEPGKVRQVQSGEWNYHHPMLLLGSTRLAAGALGIEGPESDPQRLVEVGRWVSASFTAGAAALLMAATWLLAGRFAGWTAGVLLLTNHQLFELAHYFKEDTALLFGVAFWFFALVLYWRRGSWGTAVLVALGAGLAASGKTLGLFTLPLSLVLVPWRLAKGKRLAAGILTLAVFLLAFGAINFPALRELADARASFQRELDLAVGGQGGLTRSIPHTVYFTALRVNVIFVLWFGMAWYYYRRCWRERASLSPAEWTVVLFPIAYLLILSFAPKTNDRYFLPATALFLCAVAMGIAGFREWLRPRLSARRLRWVSLALLVVAVGAQFPYKGMIRYYRAFRSDDTADLVAWLNTHVPAGARVAIDHKVMIARTGEDDKPHLPRVNAEVVEVDDYETRDALRKAGVTHLVLSQSVYGRYRLKSLRPKADAREEYNRKKAFYDDILSDDPLWERKRNTVIYLHPGLEVYALEP